MGFQYRMVLVVNFGDYFLWVCVCVCVAAILGLVQDVEAIFVNCW